MTGLASRPSRQLKKRSNPSCMQQGTGIYSPIRYTSCSRSLRPGQFHDWKRYISIHARNERMRGNLKENLSLLLFLFVAAVVLWFILSRMRFLVFIPVSLGGFILFVIVVLLSCTLCWSTCSNGHGNSPAERCLFAGSRGRVKSEFFFRLTLVNGPPPGWPLAAGACIACGGVGADHPRKIYPVHRS